MIFSHKGWSRVAWGSRQNQAAKHLCLAKFDHLLSRPFWTFLRKELLLRSLSLSNYFTINICLFLLWQHIFENEYSGKLVPFPVCIFLQVSSFVKQKEGTASHVLRPLPTEQKVISFDDSAKLCNFVPLRAWRLTSHALVTDYSAIQYNQYLLTL